MSAPCYAPAQQGDTLQGSKSDRPSLWQIPLPPLAEQKRIAGILDAADALRAKRREALAQLDTLLQSTFLDMFGDPVTNPMGWEMKWGTRWKATHSRYRRKIDGLAVTTKAAGVPARSSLNCLDNQSNGSIRLSLQTTKEALDKTADMDRAMCGSVVVSGYQAAWSVRGIRTRRPPSNRTCL